MTDEELKIHQENDEWIQEWAKLEASRSEIDLLVSSSEYAERDAAQFEAETLLEERLSNWSEERRSVIEDLKANYKRHATERSAVAMRRERIAAQLVPGLVRDHSLTEALEITDALIALLDSQYTAGA